MAGYHNKRKLKEKKYLKNLLNLNDKYLPRGFTVTSAECDKFACTNTATYKHEAIFKSDLILHKQHTYMNIK